jgi:N-acetylglucosaminyldiphosphoundecaprenol N-acetyl-beta-D-mannosaminyltransferase
VTKRDVLGVLVDSVEYDGAVARIVDAAAARQPFAGAALAVHGVMCAVADPGIRGRVNDLDLVTADGQPVRWALRLLHRDRLADRVYGPELMTRTLDAAAARDLPVFLYGSTPAVLDALADHVRRRHPGVTIAGRAPSRFRAAGAAELDEIAAAIRGSGARLVFVGLGCPRQEVFCHAMRARLDMPLIAVGAAFDYHAGRLRTPPALVQRVGLQWLWRLAAEPRRLWRRYLFANPSFCVLVALQRVGLWRGSPGVEPPAATSIAA